MIDRDAKVIGHRPVYQWLDPMHPGRKAVISAREAMDKGLKPDPEIYYYDSLNYEYRLKRL
jgi:hypothetical protein